MGVFNKIGLLNDLSKVFVCRSSLTYNFDFFYHDTGGVKRGVGSNTASSVIPCVVPCTQIKKVGSEGFSRGIAETKLKVIHY